MLLELMNPNELINVLGTDILYDSRQFEYIKQDDSKV